MRLVAAGLSIRRHPRNTFAYEWSERKIEMRVRTNPRYRNGYTSFAIAKLRMQPRPGDNRVELILRDQSFRTFSEVSSRVNRLANSLCNKGIGQGDRIASFAKDSANYCEAILSCAEDLERSLCR